MSGGQICRCPESKKPLLERAWRVVQYRCNHSWFSADRYAASDYSAIICDKPALHRVVAHQGVIR